jgi:hypothetical protein
MADPFLQDAVRWQPDCVFDLLGFEKSMVGSPLGAEAVIGPLSNSVTSGVTPPEPNGTQRRAIRPRGKRIPTIPDHLLDRLSLPVHVAI